MDDTRTMVRLACAADPKREWDRLVSGPDWHLEYLITTHALRRHLPTGDQPQKVLDAGGGPGRYTLLLAEWGYRPTLLDPCPALLDLARHHVSVAEPTVTERVEGIVEGTITDLSHFSHASFDAVLCLGGPLSHVADPVERRRAVGELARVVKPRAPLFISVLNRLAVFRGMVQWRDYRGGECQFWANGQYTLTINSFPVSTYFFTPDDFVDLLQAHGLVVERMYGCSGIGAHLPEENLTALMADPDRWPAWRDVLLATCDRPSVVGVSRHLLAVAHVAGSEESGELEVADR